MRYKILGTKMINKIFSKIIYKIYNWNTLNAKQKTKYETSNLKF